MFLDTRTMESAFNSLNEYFNVDVIALKFLCNDAFLTSRERFALNIDKYLEQIHRRISQINTADTFPNGKLDEVIFYHITRRLDDFNDDDSWNLKQLLSTDNPFHTFLQQHGYEFSVENDKIKVYYNRQYLDFDNEEPYGSLLRSRFGYNEELCSDFCVNGFLFDNSIEYEDYVRILSFAPEIITALAEYTNNQQIITDFCNSSKLYKYVYKFPLDRIMIDGNDNFDNRQKEKYIINDVLLSLCGYDEYHGQDTILRLADNDNLSGEYLVEKVEIE